MNKEITPKLVILKKEDLNSSLTEQYIQLVLKGKQVSEKYLRRGVVNAELIGLFTINERIISGCCFKNPLATYRTRIFVNQAKSDKRPENYPIELGYIVTDLEYEGLGLCQKLLYLTTPLVKGKKMFATTRKNAMIHILSKFGFKTTGTRYKDELQLLIQ